MPTDPQTQAMLDQLTEMNFSITRGLTPTQSRDLGKAMLQAMLGSPEPVHQVEDRRIPGVAGDIPIRVYTPAGDGPFPILVYLHGGGWVTGDLDTEDSNCRHLANLVPCLVVSVDYRLAPEHKFPAAPEDCYAATQWVAEHGAELNGDPSRIAIAGLSAGANLTAVVAQMARDRGGPPLLLQVMMVPTTDLHLALPSVDEYAEGYFLTKEDFIWFVGHYVKDESDKDNPMGSPLLATDFSGLPPAVIFTAEYDALRDDGVGYAEALKAAGVPVTLSHTVKARFVVPSLTRYWKKPLLHFVPRLPPDESLIEAGWRMLPPSRFLICIDCIINIDTLLR